MLSNKNKEYVLCFPADLLDKLGTFDGIVTRVHEYLDAITEPKSNCYVEREEAETRYDLKQIIPYLVLYSQGQILQYRRGKSGGEGRLHGLYSIGVGGHIAAEDVGYTEAMERELMEEVDLRTPWRQACVGLINDESTDVGRVHFGIVHILELQKPNAVKRESSLTKLEFVDVEHAVTQIEKYEGWSQLCLRHWGALWDRALPLLHSQEWCSPHDSGMKEKTNGI